MKQALRHVKRVIWKHAGAALDRAYAARRCPACGSRHLKQRLAACHRYWWPYRMPGLITATGCVECGTLFASPQPSEKHLAALYRQDGDWAAGHAASNVVHKDGPIVRLLDQHIGLTRPPGTASVLDVGCGSGRWLNTFARHGWHTFGIEPSTKIAFDHHQELTGIPSEPTFDVVILHHVLEHVLRPGQMLRQSASALKPRGFLFVSVPNLSGLPYHRDWYYCLNGKAHLTAYTSEALQALFARCGLNWHCCLENLQVSTEQRAGASRLRVLARKPGPGHPLLAPPQRPVDAALAALKGAGITAAQKLHPRLG